ncbi:class I SAM-dependent methyltransferase [Streptomyces sp. NPDC002143]
MTAPDRPLVWDTPAAAAAYRDRDMRLARQLIFPTTLSRLGRPTTSATSAPTALDVGCGTGALAAYLAESDGWSVQGLDPSSHMLDIARTDRPHHRVDYRLFDGRSLSWIPDASVDAVVCCLVYCADSDDKRLAALTREIHRVLRPGAPFVLADLNPAGTGREFSTVRYGEPGAVHTDGDTVSTALRQLDGDWITTACHYRSLDGYRSFLTGAGFPPPAVDLPTTPPSGDDGPAPAEAHIAPYMVLTSHARGSLSGGGR